MTSTGADFLSRIAAKAVGAAVLVEPRLPSRFEAAAGSGDSLESCRDESSATAAAAGRLEQPPRRSVAARSANEAGLAETHIGQTGDPAPAKMVPGRGFARPRPTELEPPASAQAPDARDSPLLSPAAGAEIRLAAVDGVRPLLPPPGSSPRERRMEASPPPPDLAGSLVAPLAPGPESAPVCGSSSGRADEPGSIAPTPPLLAPQSSARLPAVPVRGVGSVRADKARSSAPAPPILAPQPPARLLAAPAGLPEMRAKPARLERSAPAPVPPPVINITIGRVDVRASAPAAPAARPARLPRQAPQSLADYLKRRGGGR
jgi:hypothetical protein